MFGDKCCDDRVFLESIISELKNVDDSFFDVSLGTDPVVRLPDIALEDSRVCYLKLNYKEKVGLACQDLEKSAAENGNVIGLDIEWNPSFLPGGHNSDPATIQLCMYKKKFGLRNPAF